jgi:hypothetical protein
LGAAEKEGAKTALQDLKPRQRQSFSTGNTPYAKEVHYILSRNDWAYR